jgi:hypothetical protein
MTSSNSATEPKPNPSEKLRVRPLGLLFGAHRRGCCASSLYGATENSEGDSTDVRSGAASDEIAEHLKWATEWTERSETPTATGLVMSGQVSATPAALLGEDIVATETLRTKMTAGEEVERDAAMKSRDSRSRPRELARLDPTSLFTLDRPSRPRRWFKASLGAFVLILPAILAFLVVGFQTSTFRSASSLINISGQRNQLEPRLNSQHSRSMIGEPTPLGLTFQGSAQGAIVVITGLVPGMTLSHGSALGPNAWQVPAADLANTWIGPPQDFIGTLKLEAELHLADRATIAHQELVHEWIAAGPSDSDQLSIASAARRSESDRTSITSARADSEQQPIATGPSDSDHLSIASAARDSEQGTTPPRRSESDRTSTTSARADSEQQPIATGPSDSDQVPIASAAGDSEQGPTPKTPSESDLTSITSARADSDQRPIEMGPADPEQVSIASVASDSEQEPTARPSESDPTWITSARADSDQRPIEMGPADPEQVSIASVASDSEQEPTSRPPESDPTSITSARADSEQRPIEMGPADPEQVLIAPALPKVVRARQQFERNESATNVGEKPLAKTEQNSTSGDEAPGATSRATGREFIDAAGVVHIVAPRWRSGPRANDQHLKQVLGGSSPSSGRRDFITEDEARLAALHGNNKKQEASYPRSEHKSGASRSTPSRQIAKKRATQKKMAAMSPPVPSSSASRVRRPFTQFSNVSRPRVVFIPRHFGPPPGFPAGFNAAGASLPLALFLLGF